eukprot:SAG11_NODE_1984_length_3964_cov_26.503234_3_plen_189_part_00
MHFVWFLYRAEGLWAVESRIWLDPCTWTCLISGAWVCAPRLVCVQLFCLCKQDRIPRGIQSDFARLVLLAVNGEVNMLHRRWELDWKLGRSPVIYILIIVTGAGCDVITNGREGTRPAHLFFFLGRLWAGTYRVSRYCPGTRSLASSSDWSPCHGDRSRQRTKFSSRLIALSTAIPLCTFSKRPTWAV